MRALMKAALVAALFTFCVAMPVQAADKGGGTYSQVDVPSPKWHQTGVYAGLTLGYNAAEMSAEGFHLGDSKPLAGGLVGAQVRLDGSTIVGIEADLVFMDVSASVSDGVATVRSNNHYLGSVRGRVGIPIGPALLYATAGLGFTNAKLSATDGEASVSNAEMLFGPVAGGGIELQMTNTLKFRVEGLHYWFPDKEMRLGDALLKKEDHFTAARAAVVFNLN